MCPTSAPHISVLTERLTTAVLPTRSADERLAVLRTWMVLTDPAEVQRIRERARVFADAATAKTAPQVAEAVATMLTAMPGRVLPTLGASPAWWLRRLPVACKLTAVIPPRAANRCPRPLGARPRALPAKCVAAGRARLRAGEHAFGRARRRRRCRIGLCGHGAGGPDGRAPGPSSLASRGRCVPRRGPCGVSECQRAARQ